MFNSPDLRKYKQELFLDRKLRFFEQDSKNPQFLSKRLPFVQISVKNATSKLYGVTGNDTVEVEGYLGLKLKDDKLFSRTVTKWLKESGVDITKGYKLYEFYAELSKLPTDVLIIAPIDFQIKTELPYRLKATLLGRLKSLELVFYLKEDPEPSVLQLPTVDFPFLLTRKQIVRCLTQVSSLSMNDKHVCDSIISPYVGCDVEKINVNGVGNSFLSNAQQTSEDLMRMNDSINNTKCGIPLSHYGILNILNGNATEIQKMRSLPNYTRFKAISWNIPSNREANNLLSSEFKYVTEGINFDDLRDIKYNIALQQSLAYYSLVKDKGIPYNLYGRVMIKAIKTIEEWSGKIDESMMDYLLDRNSLNVQIARIASYYIGISRTFNENLVVRKVDTAVNDNIGSVIEKMIAELQLTERKAKYERDIDPKVWTALWSSDRTKDNFCERLMALFGWTNKRAIEYIEQLHKTGGVFTSDGVHYYKTNESNMKLK